MINPLRLSELKNRTKGDLFGCDREVLSVVTDSRVADANSMFIALSGDRHNGHDYISSAIDNGCMAIVSEQSITNNITYLRVDNSRLALAYAGAINREKFQGPVIGITGSSGKTTTKNMLQTVLSKIANTSVTKGNFNNEIGVPLTLLAINDADGFAVVEMGARHQGDIAYLGRFVQPDIAILLNAGLAHIGEFGSYDAIVKTKGEIFESLGSNGVAIVNADDPASTIWLQALRDRQLSGKQVLTFSMAEDTQADVCAEDITCGSDGSNYVLSVKGKKTSVHLPLPGRHNIANSLAVAATLVALELPINALVSGLEEINGSAGRLAFEVLVNGSKVIDDSYNANPVSMRASLDVLALQKGRRIAVLGEMGELGDRAKALHVELATYASLLDIEAYYLVGTYAQDMAQCLGGKARGFKDKAALALELLSALDGNETILIKGSRSETMEDVLTALKGHFA